MTPQGIQERMLRILSADAEFIANAKFELEFLDNHWLEEAE